jgi:hypothetical protein
MMDALYALNKGKCPEHEENEGEEFQPHEKMPPAEGAQGATGRIAPLESGRASPSDKRPAPEDQEERPPKRQKTKRSIDKDPEKIGEKIVPVNGWLPIIHQDIKLESTF